MKKNFIKILPIFAVFFIPLFFRVNLVHAAAASGTGVPTGSVPEWVATDISTHCKENWGIVSDTWLSSVGQPSQTNVNVSQGANSVDLQLNQIYYRCHVNGGGKPVNGTQDVTFISRADNTDIPVPITLTGSYPSTSLGPAQYNQIVVRKVKYTPSSPFQASQKITVNLYDRGYYSATNDMNRCSKWQNTDWNGIPIDNTLDPKSGGKNCATGMTQLTIYVAVTSVTIQGVVYGHTTGSGKVGLPGITIPTAGAVPGNCTQGQSISQSSTTDAAGSFSFQVGVDNYFCIRIPTTYNSPGGVYYSNPVITPLGSTGVSHSIGTSCSATSSSYEWQKAEVDKSATTSGANWCNYGLSSNGGYDFLYQKAQRASIAATTSVSLLKAYPGDSVTFTSTAADSNTLPDDGTDTYSYSVTPSTSASSGDTTFGACGTSVNVSSPLIPEAEATHTQSCTITIPTTSTASTTYCITTTISYQPTYASVTGSPAKACVVVLQKPTVVVTGVVNGVSPAPAEHEIGSAFDVTMRVAISCNDFIGTISYSITSLPSIYSSYSTYDCTATSPAVSNKPITISADTLNANDPNPYVFTAAITVAAGVPAPLPSSTATLRNYTVPYARFYGNDIASGSGAIYFNNHDNQPLTTSAGSAAQYAAIAKTTILVATAAFSSAPASPIGLSALTSAQVSIASTNNTSGAAWENNWSTSGYYGDINGTTTINGKNSIASKITIVGNDIYITGNITIDKSKLPSASNLFDNASIPVITLIAKNNIYIYPSVTQIDALLQAGKDIYTCSTGPTETRSGSCKNTLLVNGEVGAGNDIHFDRVCGTRLSAFSTEDSTTAGTYMTNVNPSCSGSYKSRVAAEVINFPSYLYFASPYISGATQTQYQSIYSAPPLL